MKVNVKKTSVLVAFILCANFALADSFVRMDKQKDNSIKQTLTISPLSASDEAFRKEVAKHPKNTSFYIDGKTGQIIPINKTPLIKKQVAKNTKSKNTPRKNALSIQKNYEMQEEKIELLR